MKKEYFNLALAKECAQAFSGATGLGCVVCDQTGTVLDAIGYNCSCCQLCKLAGQSEAQCVRAQNYSMQQAERFGGKYIYYCPMGLTCFISPILGEIHSSARITAGPFLMVDHDDYISCELTKFEPEMKAQIIEELHKIPVVETSRVNHLSTLLFMAVGFMNKASAANRLLEVQSSNAIQGQLSSYIFQLKHNSPSAPYPFAVEKAFLKSIRHFEKENAQRLLNELLGHILFSSGQQLDQIKSRVCELLALTGRSAVDAGANADATLKLCHDIHVRIEQSHDIEEMCLALSTAVNHLMDSVFQYADIRHAHIIHLCMQYIETHYYEKITLEQMADMVFLSPSYLSRIFKKETGTLFNDYINNVRITKAKALLNYSDLRITDVSDAVGFDDQSYFTKVFRRITGVTPKEYRSQTTEQEHLLD